MTEVVHADVFFFITAVAVVVLSVLAAVLLYYAIGIAREVRTVVVQVRKASDDLSRDLDVLRSSLAQEGRKGRAIVDLALGFITRRLQPPAAKRTRSKEAGRGRSSDKPSSESINE
jgi:hypothetical protein